MPARSAEIPQQPKKRQIDFKAQQQAQHAATISLIVKNTGKIQKEIGFRRARLKKVYQKCSEAIDTLNKFKDVPWPPPKIDPTASVAKDEEEDFQIVPAVSSIDLHDSSDTDVEDNEEKMHMGESNDLAVPNDGTNAGADVTEDEFTDANTTVVETLDDLEEVDNVDMGITTATTDEMEEAKDLAVAEAQPRAATREDTDGIDMSLDEGMEVDTVTTDDVYSEKDEEEQGQGNDEMRPEVLTAISCYCLTIAHPAATSKMIEIALECIGLLISNRYVIGSTIAVSNEGDLMDESDHEEDFKKGSDVTRLINCICECADNSSDAVQCAMTKDLLSLMTSPVCSVHEAGMLKAVRTVFHIYLITKHEEVKKMSREVLLDMLRSVFQRMEAYDAMAQGNEGEDLSESFSLPKSPHNSKDEEDGTNNLFVSRFHTDSYLLFRALCKLSAKPLPEDADDSMGGSPGSSLRSFAGSKIVNCDPMATATKILSLELILSVFEHCGPAFRNGKKFIYAVQKFLCVSLLKNCVSSNTTVAHKSLQVFLLLVYKFKTHMKAEIEVFIANVFLPVLESQNCPFERKSLVLEALRALCADPVILTSIFLNYDCDFDAVNLYKTIVYHLTSLSIRGRSIQTPLNKTKPISDNFALSVAGLEVLVVILRGFLKALNLPGGDDNFDDERSKVRGNLQLDVGMAVKSEKETVPRHKISTEDMAVTAEEIKNLENGTANMDIAGKIVDAFDKKRQAQQEFETGCIKFKLSYKQGLLFFIKSGLLHMDAKEIASFFYAHKEVLDKTQIGEIFGREPDACFVKDKDVEADKGGVGFYIRVLHHYVDVLDFTEMKFDDAIRLFLSGFRLPGESQKVDRVMEKFAEQYTLQNEDVFPSADTCFILAFAVIMLQTDLHSPNIKPEKKMTQEAFLNMNRGISVDGGDLPSDFLIDLYLSIKKRPFTLKEDDDARNHQKKNEETGFNDVFFGTAAEERRRVLYKKERAELVESTEKLFKKQKGGSAIEHEFTSSVDPSDVVKPMYDITWGPLLGALSQILEKAEDDTSIALCLNGFVYAIRVASHTNTTLARRTFVNSLAKFTALGSIRELKSRNIECIRTLLSIAIMDGEKLGDSWMPILQCISQLSRLSFFGSGVDSNDDFLNSDAQSTKSLQSSETRETEEINGRVVLEAIHEILIEKVFSSTTKLSDKGVLDIIECLVNVSISEIEGDSKKGITGVGRSVRSLGNSDKTDISRKGSNTVVDGPRVFSLQKLLEVADYNMNSRSRLSWAKIWELMANHFVVIGCHDNAMVSMFAIDGLRQLSFKFLEKPELADFNFQRLFLQPFLAIISNPNTLADTRELILQCVDNTIRSLSHNLRSGWRVFFAILSHSANDASVGNSSLGLSILQRLVDCHLDDFCAALKDENRSVDDGKEEDVQDKELSASEVKEQRVHVEDFIGLCGASLAFIETEKELPMALSMRALCHVACYADRIAEGKVLPPLCSTQSSDRTLPGYTYDGLSPKEGREMILWRLIFDGLARGLRSSVSCSGGGVGCFVQRGSVMTLRSILLRHGTCFSANQWKVIMNCSILPAIEMAAKSDTSPVMNIISESPTVSNLDFITEPQPLPPAVDDEGLRQFAEESKLDDRHHTSKRSMGHAELLVEASFVDLKHGGSGDLTQAYTLLRKAPIQKNIEEPFPNSWVATTAPIALGMLTDIFCLIASNYEAEEAKDLWPVTIGQMQKWAVGSPFGISSSSSQSSWAPCEALVRIGCKEISHLSDTVFTLFPSMEEEDVTMWLGFLCQNLAESLSHNIELERELHESVSREIKEINQVLLNEQTILSADDDERSLSFVHTQYGSGTLDGQRTDKYKDGNVTISIVKLESGATLYGTIDMKSSQDSNTMENELSSVAQLHSDSVDEVRKVASYESANTENPKTAIVRKFIRPIRVRCTSISCLQNSFFHFLGLFSANCNQAEISLLLDAVEFSRAAAEKASVDEDLSSYFVEAMRREWSGEVLEVQAAYTSDSGLGHLGRCEMFFLTQEAGANNILVRLLSLLYCPKEGDSTNAWDTVTFSEPLLMSRMTDVLQKFIVSERENGHKLDPNVWRAVSESGTKFAIHCTSFAAVVANILHTILDFSDAQFDRQKGTLFPVLCQLISVQSEEIRMLVSQILRKKVSVLLEIP